MVCVVYGLFQQRLDIWTFLLYQYIAIQMCNHLRHVYINFNNFTIIFIMETIINFLLVPNATLTSYKRETKELELHKTWFTIKGILWDCFIFTLEQIIFLNKYCTYNKPNPKYHMSKHSRTCVNKMRYKICNNKQ